MQKQNATTSLRLSDATLARLRAQAEREGRSVATLIRDALNSKEATMNKTKGTGLPDVMDLIGGQAAKKERTQSAHAQLIGALSIHSALDGDINKALAAVQDAQDELKAKEDKQAVQNLEFAQLKLMVLELQAAIKELRK